MRRVQQVRLAEALRRLENGASVAESANDLGYASPSAFAAMFRHAMGQSPTDFLAELERRRQSGSPLFGTSGRLYAFNTSN